MKEDISVSKDKSYSQQKREGYDYRRYYLEHNPGILGHYFVCSQCGKFLEVEEMEVDHIVPNSSPLAPNRVINCVSICSPCNKKKSNKVGWVTVKGVIAKLFEELYILIHKVVVLSTNILALSIKLLIALAVKPLTDSRSFLLKITLVICYVLLVVYLFNLLLR